ncbi:MAG: hypothetical protein AB3N15_01450, partial [Paracoccaceae bacterium]
DRAPREADRTQDADAQLQRGDQTQRDPSRTPQPPRIEHGTERVEEIAQTGVTGVIVSAKEAYMRPDDPSSKSFQVDMKVEGKVEPQRLWGTALQDQMARNNISIGDTVTFIKAGKEEVTRSRRNPETDEPERVNVTRTAWDVKNIDRQIDRDPVVQGRLRRDREDRAKGDRGFSR